MSPGAFERALRTGDATIAVLSADADFMATVWDVGHGQPGFVHLDTWPALLEAVGAGRCGIVLLDVDHLGQDLDGCLAELERFDPPPVVVTAGDNRRAPEMMRMHAERRIHRLLVKPATPGKLQLLLSAAITRSRQPRQLEDQPVPSGPSYRPPRQGTAMRGIGRWMMLSIGMAVVFAAVVTIGLGWKAQRDATSAAAPPSVEPAVARVERLAEPSAPPLVGPPFEVAAAPAGGWSLGYDGQAAVESAGVSDSAPVAVSADESGARAGTSAEAEALFAQVERALLEDELDQAAAALEALRQLAPDSTRLAFLDAQLERARRLQAATQVVEAPAGEPVATAVAEPVAAPPPRPAPARNPLPAAIAAAERALDAGDLEGAERRVAEARRLGANRTAMAGLDQRLEALRETKRRENQALLLGLGLESIGDGRLLAPESDNAVHYLASLQAENPAYPGLDDAVWALTPQLVDAVRGAIAAGDWPAATDGLVALERIGAPEGIVAPLAVEIEVTRRQLDYLRVPAAPGELELVRSRSPIYPQVAVRKGTEGWAELEVIVDRDGVPREVTVIGEEPAGVFGRAAADAVERYRYQPFVLNGVTYERLVRVRVEFALD
jgi:TonB family protein